MSNSEKKSFFSTLKVGLLFLLALLVFGVAMAVWVPVGWLWQQMSPRIDLPPEITVNQVSGQLWRGAAGLTLAEHSARLQWELGMPSITGSELPVRFSLTTPSSRIDGDALIKWPGNARIRASGLVHVGEFEKLIRQYRGAMIAGNVEIDRLYLEVFDNRIRQAEGIARWPGGLVTWPMGARRAQANFPPMQAALDTSNEGLALTVSEQGGGGPAAKAVLLGNGVMDIRLYKRMVDLAEQPWSDAASPDDIIFRVRQPLLPGGG